MFVDDWSVRKAAFSWLADQVGIHGDVLPRHVLALGFNLEGHRVPLLGPQGIFKPAVLETVPLSITTAPNGPYKDVLDPGGLLLYKYRGTDPKHRDNVGVRLAFEHKIPLVYLHGVMPGKYVAAWPVYVVRDDPLTLTFTVAVDDIAYIAPFWEHPRGVFPVEDISVEIRRRYVTATCRRRIHQQAFRERVLQAYQEQCALCRLKHDKLLDAAHIVPDSDPEGEPVISNGIALCKLHHAAFDGLFFGIRPDGRIHVRPQILLETDGPMLLHGLKAIHETLILVPHAESKRPNPQFLEKRYRRFLADIA